jgi:membrane fusion protein (multidrug efflux system)
MVADMRHSVHESESETDSGEASRHDHGKEEEPEAKRHHQTEEDLRESRHHDDSGETEKEGKGENEAKAKEDGKESKGFRPSKKAIIIGALILAIMVIGGLLYWMHARHFVSTDDAYTIGHVHQISARVSGTVSEVLVDDNQQVKTNEIVVRLDPRDFQVALQKAQAAWQQAQAQASQAEAKIAQTKAQRAAAASQVTQAQAQVSQARAQLEKARSDYDRVAGLYSKDIKAVSKADVDAATEAFDRTRSALEGAQANLTAVQAQLEAADANVNAAEADARVAAANVASAETQVKDAELQLSYCDVVAPVAGKVSRKTVEEGQRLQPGQPLMAIVPQNIWVIANLKETQLERLQIGQRVDIRIDALANKTFIGSVDSIQEGSGATFSLLPPDNATGNFTKIVQRVPVKIVFDPDSIRDFQDRIVPGLSVEPKIDLESLHDNRREAKRQKREEKQNRDAESGR